MYKKSLSLSLLLLLALLVRLVLAPYHGFTGDMQTYISWGQLFDSHPLHVYSLGAALDPAVSYPPLGIYFMGIWTGLYFGAAHLLGAHPIVLARQSGALAFWMKLPDTAADLGVIVILYRLARQQFSERMALIAAASYAFNPAMLFDGPLWGQTDAIIVLLLLLSLLATLRKQAILAGMLLAAAFLFKPQPVVFIPVVVVYLWRWAGWQEGLQALGSILLTSLVVCAPYLIPPKLEILAFLHNFTSWSQSQNPPYASPSAFNLWWLLGSSRNYTAPFLGPFSPQVIGDALFFAILLVAQANIWRDASASRFFLGAALVGLAFFDVTVLQHERYLYQALALFFVAGLTIRPARRWYVIASLTTFGNMAVMLVLFDRSGDFGPWRDALLQIQTIYVLLWLSTFLIALVNLGLLVRVLLTMRPQMLRRPSMEDALQAQFVP